ncbi:MAG: DNA alkylation repair protein, partial [Leptospiraceae bacterium]|nr:DNA alkylation repair protein [Leptospiraceae bacterium]
FEFEHKEKFDTKMRLEYGIYYLKKNGKQNRKIFILSEKVFSPNQKILIKRKQSFKNMTTIVHYTGAHKISILVNGIEYAEHDFILL